MEEIMESDKMIKKSDIEIVGVTMMREMLIDENEKLSVEFLNKEILINTGKNENGKKCYFRLSNCDTFSQKNNAEVGYEWYAPLCESINKERQMKNSTAKIEFLTKLYNRKNQCANLATGPVWTGLNNTLYDRAQESPTMEKAYKSAYEAIEILKDESQTEIPFEKLYYLQTAYCVQNRKFEQDNLASAINPTLVDDYSDNDLNETIDDFDM